MGFILEFMSVLVLVICSFYGSPELHSGMLYISQLLLTGKGWSAWRIKFPFDVVAMHFAKIQSSPIIFSVATQTVFCILGWQPVYEMVKYKYT